jgi:glycosyltransferase involved in cell wall biosynthesis
MRSAAEPDAAVGAAGPGPAPHRQVAARVAIVHDWLVGMHGAERVVETMRRDVFSPSSAPRIYTFRAIPNLLEPGLAAAIVQQSRLARLAALGDRGDQPGRWRYLLPYMPTYFSRLDLSAFELVVSSSHACAVNVRPPESALHLCYCYTPMRYVWMPQSDPGRARGASGVAVRMLSRYLRRVDLAASARPHAYAAISTAVRDRIRAFYGRDAEVIHPPVDVHDFDPTAEKEPGRFVWAQRLVAYKRPELVAEAFRGLPHHLTMIGIGPLEQRLRATAPPNVEVVGWLDRGELRARFARASGFIHVGEEDFGIAMVEALAAGTPVVALDAGGARDIVRHDVDGVLLRRPELDELRRAITRVASATWDRSSLAARATAFSREQFVERMRAFVAAAQRERER